MLDLVCDRARRWVLVSLISLPMPATHRRHRRPSTLAAPPGQRGGARLASHGMSIRRTEETDLCRIAARHDTDKVHPYTRVYYDLLAHVRQKRLRVLEIGVYNGGSLRMWRDFLPNARLFGIDIDSRCLAFEQEIVDTTIRLVDQGNASQLTEFVEETGGQFDLIVDDGGHTMTQQTTSFEVLFPHVVTGGVYVIEDIGTAYWEEFGGRDIGVDGTSVALVKRLIDSINVGTPKPPYHSAVSPESIAQLRGDVASVCVHPGLAVIVRGIPWDGQDLL